MILLMSSVVALLIIFCHCVAKSDDCDLDYYDWGRFKKIVSIKKKIITISMLLLILGLLVPSKKTCYQMLISSYITPNNIEIVKDNAKDIVDYIIDAAEELSDKKEE